MLQRISRESRDSHFKGLKGEDVGGGRSVGVTQVGGASSFCPAGEDWTWGQLGRLWACVPAGRGGRRKEVPTLPVPGVHCYIRLVHEQPGGDQAPGTLDRRGRGVGPLDPWGFATVGRKHSELTVLRSSPWPSTVTLATGQRGSLPPNEGRRILHQNNVDLELGIMQKSP